MKNQLRSIDELMIVSEQMARYEDAICIVEDVLYKYCSPHEANETMEYLTGISEKEYDKVTAEFDIHKDNVLALNN